MRRRFGSAIFVVALSTLLTGLAAVSQEAKQELQSPEPAKEENREPEKPKLSDQEIHVLKDQLKLTEEQIPKVVALLEEDLAARQEIRSKYDREGADSKGLRDELRQSRQQLFKKLGDILSSGQISEYRKFLGERRKERRENRTSPAFRMKKNRPKSTPL